MLSYQGRVPSPPPPSWLCSSSLFLRHHWELHIRLSWRGKLERTRSWENNERTHLVLWRMLFVLIAQVGIKWGSNIHQRQFLACLDLPISRVGWLCSSSPSSCWREYSWPDQCSQSSLQCWQCWRWIPPTDSPSSDWRLSAILKHLNRTKAWAW